MKRKFKLVKTYPGSPELGVIAEYKDEFLLYSLNKSCTNMMLIEHIENNPEFWEEIVEKDYEILSFALKNAYKLETSIRFKNKWGLFPSEDTFEEAEHSRNNEFSEEVLLKDKDYYIHSIKRLSDGEIFTIGDKIQNGEAAKLLDITIKNFDVNDEYLVITTSGSSKLKSIEHRKQPILTTEDGVDIFEGDPYTFIWVQSPARGQNTFKPYEVKKAFLEEDDSWSEDARYFSSKEKAEDYVFLNTPSLSIQDLVNIQKSRGCLGDSLIGFAKAFVKSKK